MRPRGRERDSPTASASPPPAWRPKGSLSSMVVLPDAAANGAENDSEIENGDARSADRRIDDAPVRNRRSSSRRFSEDSGSLSPSPQQKSKYHRYDPDVEESGEPQRRHQSPYPRRPENHHYDPEFDRPGQDRRRSLHLRRTLDYHRYDQGYEHVGRPRGRGSSLRRRFDHHLYDPNFDHLPERGPGSPLQRKLDQRHYDYELEQPGAEHGRELWGERGGGRFRRLSPTYGRGQKFRDVPPSYGRGRRGGRLRNVSPSYGRGRGDGRFHDVSPPYVHVDDERFYERDSDDLGPGDVHFRGIRNDPNLAPRVGDWICKNPSCGNLNFARREYCNKCNKFRFGYVDEGAGASPRRSYSGPPSPHGPPSPQGPPPRFSGPQHDRGPQRDANSYRSPPCGWARDSPGRPPSLRNGGKFRGPGLQRGRGKSDYYEDDGLGGRGRFDRMVSNRERHEFTHERRGYDQRAPSLHDRWENDPRQRSRSPPVRARSPRKDFGRRSSYVGRGRGDR